MVFQPSAGQHAQQRGGDRWQGAEQSFRVVIPIPFESGEILGIDPVGEVPAFLKMPGPDARHRHQREERPITQQQGNCQDHPAALLQKQISEAPRQAANGDPLQHPQPAHRVDFLGKPAVTQQAQHVEQQGAFEELDHRSPPAGNTDIFIRGIHQRHPGDENKEREDQVQKTETGPCGVIQLLRHKSAPRGVAGFEKRHAHFLHPENPEHIEAAQDIETHQTLTRRRRNSSFSHNGGHPARSIRAVTAENQ